MAESFISENIPYRKNGCGDIFSVQKTRAIKDLKNKNLPKHNWDIPLANDVGKVGKNGLPNYKIKPWITQLFDFEMEDSSEMPHEIREALKEVKIFMNKGLNEGNFQKFQTFLLYAEEHEVDKEFKKNTFKVARLRVSGESVLLEVPGLSESSLSVISGMELSFELPVFGKSSNIHDRVQKIDQDTLYLEDEGRMVRNNISDKMRGVLCKHIRFFPNKINYRRMHRAIWNIDKKTIHRLLMGSTLHIPKVPALTYSITEYFNDSIRANREQSQAVKHILNGTSYPYPYILFGPPGTGKTQTLTEIILQVWKLISDSRIVVAAPSNAAADVLALKLIQFVPKSSIVRLMSRSRKPHTELNNIVRYRTKFKKYDVRRHQEISLRALLQYKIIVTTLGSSAILFRTGDNKFTHVLVDEASQTTVSEILLPIVGVLKEDGHIILAGDPEQLGPVVKSEVASQYGMKTSLLERLMDSCSLYRKNKEGVRNPQFITKLLKSFRSHPDLIKLPSKLFYDNELIPAANLNEVSKLCKLPFIPNKGFPILFHAVNFAHYKSKNTRSHSLFNEKELQHVCEYIKLLQRHSVPTSSIGVLSPYKLQVTKIKEKLKKMRIEDILVGSTEEFQGEERDVMIISMVRSSLVSNMPGFLNDEKRFNVAITRAKSLMIVIGDNHLLSNNYFKGTWKHLVEYVKKNKNIVMWG